jgi:hypothetical protein
MANEDWHTIKIPELMFQKIEHWITEHPAEGFEPPVHVMTLHHFTTV